MYIGRETGSNKNRPPYTFAHGRTMKIMMLVVLMKVVVYAEEQCNHGQKGGERPPPFMDLALG